MGGRGGGRTEIDAGGKDEMVFSFVLGGYGVETWREGWKGFFAEKSCVQFPYLDLS